MEICCQANRHASWTLCKFMTLRGDIFGLTLNSQRAKDQTRPRVHWCPTGAFSFVPVHAAGIYEGPNQECCADYVVSSYTPTLTALLQAQHGADACALTHGQVRLLAIAAEDAHDANMPRLKHVMQEVKDTVNSVKQKGAFDSFDAHTADHADVLARLQSANMVHFACHGVQNTTEPHNSRFCLTTGDLTVFELINMDLKHAFFAYLSACETAKGDETHVDEAVHLAATMLFAGFKSVVATMW
jgi:CHAT domain-containing protein